MRMNLNPNGTFLIALARLMENTSAYEIKLGADLVSLIINDFIALFYCLLMQIIISFM